jgi:hypothetical protein
MSDQQFAGRHASKAEKLTRLIGGALTSLASPFLVVHDRLFRPVTKLSATEARGRLLGRVQE